MKTYAFVTVAILIGLSPTIDADEAVPRLRKKPTAEHRIGPGDVLGIMVETVLGDPNARPGGVLRIADVPDKPNTNGYPILVQDDGTIGLPYVDEFKVEGLTTLQVELAIREAYSVKTKVLTGKERIVVKLLQSRK